MQLHYPTAMRMLVAVVSAAVLAALLPLSAASAQSVPQHEMLISIDFDGTATFTADLFDDGMGAHTPGLDLNANNSVVRSNDQIQYAMNWNVNEGDANNVTMNVTLPEGVTWLPDATTVTGVPGGCTDDGTSSITGNGGRDLVCIVNGFQIEGSNGAIHPRALVGALVDGELVTVAGTVQSDENPVPADSNTVQTTVSAAPAGDWQKGLAEVNTDTGETVAFEPDEVHLEIANDAGELGTVFIWNLRLTPTGGLKGFEAMNDAQPITFFDHFFDSVTSAVLADTASMVNVGPNTLGQIRVNCGGYDGDGSYPYGQTAGVASTTPAAQTNIGVWACTDLGAPNGYPVVQIDITGQDTQNIATQNADLSGNSSTLVSGQIAFWASNADLGATGLVQNAITSAPSGTDITVPSLEVPPIPIFGTTATVDESTSDSTTGTAAGISNTSPYQYVTTPTGGTPGHSFTHAVSYFNAPYQLADWKQTDGSTFQWLDHRVLAQGGIGRYVPNAAGNPDSGGNTWWDGDAVTPRGNVLTVMANLKTSVTSTTAEYFEPVHQCVAIDTTHQEVIAMPATYNVTLLGDTFNGASASVLNTIRTINGRDVIGATTGTPTSPIANLIIGNSGNPTVSQSVNIGGLTVDRGAPTYFLEVSGGPSEDNSVGVNAVTCNDGDGPWVDAVNGDLSQFITGTASDGSTIYGRITHFRVRTEGDVPWAGFDHPTATRSYGTAFSLGFNVRVKDDTTAQAANQELFVYSSRGSGEWNGIGQPPTGACTRVNSFGANETVIPVGWCNLPYTDDGGSSTDIGDNNNDYSGTAVELTTNAGVPTVAHADVVYIVEAQLAVSKSNTAGPSEIVANGNITEFGISPAVVGSPLDEIDAVVLTDTLPPTMSFVGFTSQPANGVVCSFGGGTPAVSPLDPTQTVLAGGTITCDYGDDLNGGWGADGAADFTFEVMIVAAPADSQLINNVELEGDDPTGVAKTAAKSRASVFTGAPFDESVIVKAVDTGKGDCVAYPDAPVDALTLDAEPADWADRCELIEFENAAGSGASTMGFLLEMANQGNTDLTGVRFVDVLPHNLDESEQVSNTLVDGVPVPTLGDGRTPETDTAGTTTFVALSGAVTDVWVSGDLPLTISRDPDYAIVNSVWCDAPGGTVQNPGPGVTGSCPLDAAAVTAVYAFMDDIPIGGKITATMVLDTVDHECDDIWTNAFGARVAQIGLPVRSNDVSIQVDCMFDLALEKIIAPTWAPAGDWLTPGTSTVDFVIDVHIQGDGVNNFEVTDYVDPAAFTFDPALNPTSTTLDGLALPFAWDMSGANPVALVNGPTVPGSIATDNLIPNGAIIQIPVTLTVAAGYVPAGPLANTAEISNFDNDADPLNGDAASGDLIDMDSTPDGIDGDLLIDGEIDDNGTLDEDDHDIAIIPVWDLEIDKSNPTMTQTVSGDWVATFDITVTNASNQTAFSIGVLETPPPGLTHQTSTAATVLVTDVDAAAVAITDADPDYTINQLAPGDAVTFTVVYDVTDLTLAPYQNSVQIASFDDDNDPFNALAATTVDADSLPGNDDDTTASNEDDDDSESINLPIDLALVKKVDLADLAYQDIMNGIQDGDLILFQIEVFNQLGQVEDFDVTDYLSPGWVFDPAAQPATLVTAAGSLGGPALPFTWDVSGVNPVAQVDGVFPGFMSVLIPVVLTVDLASATGDLKNEAEISRFDDDGDPTNGDSADGTLTDLDSTADGVNDDLLVDDEFNDDGTLDEDDHDVAFTRWYDVAIEKDIFDGTDCVDGPAALTASTTEVEYCITVTNEGLSTTLYLIGFADTPPAGMTFLSTTVINAGPSGNVTDLGGGAYQVMALAPGASETVQLTYAFDIANATATLTNTAEVTEMFSDPAGTTAAADIDSFADATPDDDAPLEDDESAETATIPYDLALTKTLGPIDGTQVTMYLTVENQSIAIETVDVTDYIDSSMWLPFDTALNPDSAVDAASSVTGFNFAWDGDPAAPTALITPMFPGAKIGFGDTVVIPIVLEISPDWVGPELKNTAEISNFDSDGDPSNGDAADGTLVDGDSTPDTDNGADEDEDDHDSVLIPIYDLALGKTLDPATVQPVLAGSEVTFLIEITNQGNTHATNPSVLDYIDLGSFEPFDAGLGANAAGTTAGDVALPFAWTPSGNDGEVVVTGTIAPGESVIVPVTLQVVASPIGTLANNTAEISGGVATDADGTEITDGAGGSLQDLDSIGDGIDDDTVVDDVTDGSGGDEDDHDIAPVIIAPLLTGGLEIEKATNGIDSDVAPGHSITAGDPVTWTYVVTNNSNLLMLDVTVNDSDATLLVDCGDGTNVVSVLEVDATVTCEANGIAVGGAYTNDSSVSGLPAIEDPTNPGEYLATGQPASTDEDSSNYTGVGPAVELEKFTNGVDSDVAPGESILEGDAVTWTYVVTNTGDTPLIDLTVSDDQDVTVDCGDGTNVIAVLAVDEVVTCTGEGVALATPYTNLGSISGTPAFEDPANPGSFLPVPGAEPIGDDDPSNYTGIPLALDLALEKTLDPATAEGPIYTFIIDVINQGTVSAVDVEVVDHLPEGMTVADTAWTDNGDGTASHVVAGPIAPGETVTLTIDTEISGSGSFTNLAGIENAQAAHPATGAPLDLQDIDSTFGDSTEDPMVDGVTDNSDGDEDDSDGATITVAANVFPRQSIVTTAAPAPAAVTTVVQPEPASVPEPSPPLALTGSESTRLALFGSLLVAGGAFVVFGARRRSNRYDTAGKDQLNWQPLD